MLTGRRNIGQARIMKGAQAADRLYARATRRSSKTGGVLRLELYAKLAAAQAEARSSVRPRDLDEVMMDLRESLAARRRPRRTGAASASPHGRRARR